VASHEGEGRSRIGREGPGHPHCPNNPNRALKPFSPLARTTLGDRSASPLTEIDPALLTESEPPGGG
jgi:hypothetical protein